MFNKLALAACTLAVSAGSALAANDALNANPTVANADLTTHGSDFLWAIFAAMLASALGVTIWAFMVPAGQRAFHWIGVAILFTASIAYFSLAADLGSTPVYVEFVRYKGDLYTNRAVDPYTRSIWYARYIDWTITTPLLLLELLLGTGMPLSGIFAVIFFDIVMIEAGLIGALVPSSYKWGYFAGATVALLYISWSLIFPARANAKALGHAAHSAYLKSAGILCFLWLLYPVCWGLADGGNVISTDGEMVFYGVLDFLAKPVFLIIHLLSLRSVPYEVFQLQSGHYSVGATSYTGVAPNNEKRAPVAAPATAAAVAAPETTKKHGRKASKNNAAPATTQSGVVPHGAPQTYNIPGEMYPTGGARASDVTAV